VRTKKIMIPRVPKLNPVKHAQTLARLWGAERALAVAEELVAGGRAADERLEGREIPDFMSPQEVKSSIGFWRTVAGYLRKRLPVGAGRKS
jgi:hypothetical protein